MLRQRSRPYLFSNSLPPPIVGASLAAFELLDESGEVVRRAHAVAGEDVGARAVLDVADVDPGTKVLRVTRARSAGAASVRAVPPPVG